MPESSSLPHNYLVIEGNIGAGKTTLSRRLAQDYGRRLILEEFADNPFLPRFYREPARYAFPVELFFMAERHKQLQEELARPELFSGGVVGDYIFEKTRLFARNSLNDEEFRLFNRLYGVMSAGIPPPDLLVYLHRPLPALRANIDCRGRTFETDIPDDYLESVQRAYLEYFRTQGEVPVLLLDLGDRDFQREEAAYRAIVTLLHKTYPPGLHRVDLRAQPSGNPD